MTENEYFTCQCVYSHYGYILCDTCAVITGEKKKPILAKRWKKYFTPVFKYNGTKNPHQDQENADTLRIQNHIQSQSQPHYHNL